MPAPLLSPPKAFSFLVALYYSLLNFTFVYGQLPAAPQAQDVLWGMTQKGGPLGGGTAFSLRSDGTDFTVRKAFLNLGKWPNGSLTIGNDGFLYGMGTLGGREGSNGTGTIFRIKRDGTNATLLRNFSLAEGSEPRGSLVVGSDGFLYGMTQSGGSNHFGTIFKLKGDGTSFTVLRTLSTEDGTRPGGDLVEGADGFFYGLTASGGSHDSGTVFKLKADGSAFTVLRNFMSADGINPTGSLIQGRDGLFYGTTTGGGNYGLGTIFSLKNDGTAFTILRNFSTADGRNSIYYFPDGSLTEGSDGSLYGMTLFGGSYDSGTVFKFRKDGTNFTVLRNLSTTDGTNPHGRLKQGRDGLFYGMTRSGGSNNFGTIFRLNSDGTDFTVLRNISFPDGIAPLGSLIQDSNGYFYGMTPDLVDDTSIGNGFGTIFKFKSDGTGFTVLSGLASADGLNPTGSLVQGIDDFLYGMTTTDSSGKGVIFKIKMDGSNFTVLRNLSDADGGYPEGSLLQGSDGFFYGMAVSGGNYGFGTLFKIKGDGTGFSVIKYFDGYSPYPTGSLIEGSDSFLYGITGQGSYTSNGTIFKIKTDGTNFTVLRNLSQADGTTPTGSLIQGTDGFFYGLAGQGGNYGLGTVFKLKEDGTGFAVLRHLSTADGTYPWGDLTQGPDGFFFGMTTAGGTNNQGTVFKLQGDGTGFTVLRHLSTADGGNPQGNLVIGSDSLLYGMASKGGSDGYGTLFKLKSDGTGFAVLRNLSETDGGNPLGSLLVVRQSTTAPTITGLDPTRNAVSALRDANVSVTFSQAMNAATDSNAAIQVHGSQTGLRTLVGKGSFSGEAPIRLPSTPLLTSKPVSRCR